MTEPHKPDLQSHPHISEEPIRTGNPPETQADREDVLFRPPTWVVDRMSAGVLYLILVGLMIAVGLIVVGFLFNLRFW
jgi:hypothetical protein